MKKVFALAILVVVVTSVGASAQIIEHFDGYAAPGANGSVMFRQPSFSGSTADGLEATPNVSQVVNTVSASGPNSLFVSWQWKTAGTWLRLTTYNTPNRPNPAIDYSLVLQFKVLYTAGDPLGICIGTRDNGTAAPIGGDGGGSGEIEWIGATGSGPAATRTLSAAPGWQTVSFVIPSEPIAGLTGDGVLSNARGTLEHIAFVRTGAVGPYELYLDDFEMVPVPEPSSLLALGTGLTGIVGLLRRRRI